METQALKFLLDHWLSSFMLVFARVLGFANIGPVISHPNIPVLVRVALSFALTIIISPLIPSAPKDYSRYNYFLSLAINLGIGLLIGFLTRLVLDIVQTSGEVMDNELGLSSASLLDPITREPTPVLSQFFRNFAIALFLHTGGLELTIMTFVKSFKIFPLTSLGFTALNLSLDQVMRLTGNVIILGIIGAAPVLVILVFMDIVLSLISRAAPNVRPSDLSFTLKPLVGMLIILFMLPLFKNKIVEVFLNGVRLFE